MRDISDPKARRRFYLDRGLRKRPIGSGSALGLLMALQRSEVAANPRDIFGRIPVLVAGGVATRAFMPERQTKDIGFLVSHDLFPQAVECLQKAGYQKGGDLAFPSATLGLYGQAWNNGSQEIDILSSVQIWCLRAFEGHVEDQTGLRVVPLPYLVLMKFDAARGIDQGDLTRMLGAVSDAEVESIASIVAEHTGDPAAADDIRQYAQLGHWELGRETK